MALRVNTNVAALNALRHLNRTEQALSTNLERRSSGRRLNKAADGPAALVISEQMKSQISSIDQAIRNTETSVSMVQTTEGALSEVSNMLINLRQLAVHGANEGANDEKMLQADQNEVENLLATMKRIAMTTQFGTQALLDGSRASTGVAVGDGLEFVSASELSKSSPSEGYKVNVTQVATRPLLVSTRSLTLQDVNPQNSITFVVNTGNRTTSIDLKENRTLWEQVDKIRRQAGKDGTPEAVERAGRTIQQLLAGELQAKLDDTGMDLEVFVYQPSEMLGVVLSDFDSLNDTLEEMRTQPGGLDELAGGNEVIVIRHRQFGSEPTFTITSNVAGFFRTDAPANSAVAAIPGRDVEGTIGGNPETGGGEVAIGKGQLLMGAPSTDIEGVAVRYTNTTEDELFRVFSTRENRDIGLYKQEKDNDFLVGESVDGYVHITQNALSFQIGPNQVQNSKFSLQSVNPEELARSVENESGFRSLNDITLLSADESGAAITVIDEAIGEVAMMRGDLGSFQRNTLEANLNNLRISKENLTASESQLADTDMAAEMSSLVKNQILLASGTAMLAQANQVPQSVMQLLNVGQ